MSFGVDQEQHVRAIFHRFRACKPEHQDRYHDECPDCLLIETNDTRCIDTGHTRDATGKCMTCELLDARIAGVSPGDENRILHYLRTLSGRKD